MRKWPLMSIYFLVLMTIYCQEDILLHRVIFGRTDSEEICTNMDSYFCLTMI